MDKKSKISVIIPVKDSASTLGECLESIFSSSYPNFEVIIVDDGCKDNSLEIAHGFPCKIISSGDSGGVSAARNAGARSSDGETLFFIDADIILLPDSLSIINEKVKDKGISGVVGLLSTRLRYSNFCSQYKNLWMHYTYLRQPDQVSLFYTSAAAIRRQVFWESGGFDENYRQPNVEDTELGQRLASLGYRLVACKELQVEHVKHYSMKGLLKTDFIRAGSLLKVALRNGIGRLRKGNSFSVPSTFILSVPLSFVIPFLFLTSLITYHYVYGLLALLCILMVIILNFKFLNLLRALRGNIFYIFSCLFLLVDSLVVDFGMIYGFISYLTGRRY